jgi:hypothetical protein
MLSGKLKEDNKTGSQEENQTGNKSVGEMGIHV